MTDEFDRYSRQIRFGPFGEAGQQKLSEAHVLICGCGALGSVLSESMVRAGVGRVRIVDRDYLEMSNLQRQVLFDEADVAAGLPKAAAAAEKLRRINSQVAIEEIVADLDATNITSLLNEVDLILDGTDNFETRYLLNDASIKFGIPWIYGGCIGAEGQSLTVLPGKTHCLRCLMPEIPPAGSSLTCDTVGVLGPIINLIASLQACEALKILSGNLDAVSRHWTVIDLWSNQIQQLKLDALNQDGECPTCHRREFPWLSAQRGSQSAILCGRNAVQVSPSDRQSIDLDRLADQWATVGVVTKNRFLIRLAVDQYQLTVFADGRAIVGGTEDLAEARSLYARYVGS